MPWPNLEVETSEIRLTEPAEDDLDTDEGTGSPSYTNKIEESLVPETPNRWIEDLTPKVVDLYQDMTDIVPPVDILPVMVSGEEILPEALHRQQTDVPTVIASTTNQEIVEEISNEGRHNVEQEKIESNEDTVLVEDRTLLDSNNTHSTEQNETMEQGSSPKAPDQGSTTYSSGPFTNVDIGEKLHYIASSSSANSFPNIPYIDVDLEDPKSDGPCIDNTELTAQEQREEIIKQLSNHNTNIPDIINPDGKSMAIDIFAKDKVITTVDQPHKTILGKGVSSPANKDDQTLPNVIHSNEQGENPLESSTETSSQTSIAESTIGTSSSDKSNPRDEIDHQESDSFTHSFPNQTPSTPENPHIDTHDIQIEPSLESPPRRESLHTPITTPVDPITPVTPQLKAAEHAGSRSPKPGADSGDSIGKINPRNKGKEKKTMDNRTKKVHKRTKPVFSGKSRANRQFERKSQNIESQPNARRPEEVFPQSHIMKTRINERPNVHTSLSGVQQEEFVRNSPEPSTSIIQSPIGSIIGVPDSSEKEDGSNDMIEVAEEYTGIAHSVLASSHLDTENDLVNIDEQMMPPDDGRYVPPKREIMLPSQLTSTTVETPTEEADTTADHTAVDRKSGKSSNFDIDSPSTTKPNANQGFFAPLPWPNLEMETSGIRRDLTEPDGESEQNLSSGEESEFEDEFDEDDNLIVLNSSPQNAEVQPTRSEDGYEGDSEKESEEEFRFEDGESEPNL
ncbi:hypothetical protein NEOLI_005159, partial [Neolecta irregularis DAH-3]